MALIECPECKEQVSKSAEKCPKCGHPLKRKSSPIAVGCGTLLCLFVLMALIGECQQASERAKNPGASSVSQVQKRAELSPITWAEINNIYNAKSNMTELQKDELWKKYEGKRVRFTGRVVSVSKTFGDLSMQVKMNADTFVSDLLITLADTEMEKALKLSEGNSVTFTATLTSWGTLLPISMSDGVIESFAP